MQVLFLFLDGVGLGNDDPATNPFAKTDMPNLEELLGGHKLLADGSQAENEARLVNNQRASLLAVDACLGISGIPQSATGQAALLTGKNVPAWLGEHEGPKPTEPIVELLRHGTIFTQLRQRAKSPALLNAYPPRYFESIERGYRLPGVIALSAQQAGVHLGTKDDLFEGKAISADFSGEGWRGYLGFPDAPVLNLQQAGKLLDTLANEANLSLFEYWLTDMAGHHQDQQAARSILETLDAVIGSLVSSGDRDDRLILLTSDHGNLEDLSSRHHTRNDVPLLLIGSQTVREEFLKGLNLEHAGLLKPDLTDIAPAILKFIG